ncbi:uncharacterized protein [Narcine bancroftii]|uniref:uncharacterized protein isoform X1 n=1 Tax=Narcine bancroftii TaxID=1343680 RepID=UPI00383152BF
MDIEVILSSVLVATCLLLIKGLVAGGGVHQSPLSLEVPAGSSAELVCRYNQPATTVLEAAFQWVLPSGRLYALVPGARTGGQANRRATVHANLRTRSSRLLIDSASLADSGLYLCTVQFLEPLPIVQMEGPGTWLHVIQGTTPIPKLSPSPSLHSSPKSTGEVKTRRNGSEDVLLHPGDVKPGRNESEDVLLNFGDVKPGRNESEDVLLNFVNMDQDARRSISLLCLVGVSLAVGIGYSYWMTRRHRPEGSRRGTATLSLDRGNASATLTEIW